MKNISVLIAILLTFSACKQDKKDLAQIEPEAMDVEKVKPESEWISLFDGTNFDHWRGYLTDEMYAVITSYSIHYTKLYEKFSAIFVFKCSSIQLRFIGFNNLPSGYAFKPKFSPLTPIYSSTWSYQGAISL